MVYPISLSTVHPVFKVSKTSFQFWINVRVAELLPVLDNCWTGSLIMIDVACTRFAKKRCFQCCYSYSIFATRYSISYKKKLVTDTSYAWKKVTSYSYNNNNTTFVTSYKFTSHIQFIFSLRWLPRVLRKFYTGGFMWRSEHQYCR